MSKRFFKNFCKRTAVDWIVNERVGIFYKPLTTIADLNSLLGSFSDFTQSSGYFKFNLFFSFSALNFYSPTFAIDFILPATFSSFSKNEWMIFKVGKIPVLRSLNDPSSVMCTTFINYQLYMQERKLYITFEVPEGVPLANSREYRINITSYSVVMSDFVKGYNSFIGEN